MRIKKGFILREVADAKVVVAIGAAARSFHAIVSLNETAAYLFNLLQKGADRETLIARLTESYQVEAPQAALDVDRLVRQLCGEGMLDQSDDD